MTTYEKTVNTADSISFCGLLAILFIGLKLGGVIAWSWLWVLAPLWFGTVAILGLLVVVFLFALVVVGIGAAVGK